MGKTEATLWTTGEGEEHTLLARGGHEEEKGASRWGSHGPASEPCEPLANDALGTESTPELSLRPGWGEEDPYLRVPFSMFFSFFFLLWKGDYILEVILNFIKNLTLLCPSRLLASGKTKSLGRFPHPLRHNPWETPMPDVLLYCPIPWNALPPFEDCLPYSPSSQQQLLCFPYRGVSVTRQCKFWFLVNLS